jgi:hypothetical protein
MKHILKLSVFLLLLTIGSLQAQDKKANWPELKSFHSVMAQTFHPAEEGNLKPIRERIAEFITKAKALRDSKIPAEYKNTKEIKAATEALVMGGEKLETYMKANAESPEVNKVVLAKLSELHDTFHTIVGLCKPDSDHH